MTLNYRNFFIAALLFSFFAIPLLSFAQTPQGNGIGQTPQGNGIGQTSQGNGVGQTSQGNGLGQTSQGNASNLNPLKGIDDFCELALAVYSVSFRFFGAIAALAFAYGGISFVLARGNPEKLAKAKLQFAYIVIGIVVFFAAFTFAKVILNTLIALGADNSFNSCLH